MAPLDFKSIYKMLTWRVVGDLTSQEHAKIVCSEAMRHAFLHGRARYDEFVKNEIIHAHEFLNKTFPILTYDEQIEFFMKCDKEGIPYTYADT